MPTISDSFAVTRVHSSSVFVSNNSSYVIAMVGRVGMLLSVWCAGPTVVMFQNAALLWLYESEWFKAAGW